MKRPLLSFLLAGLLAQPCLAETRQPHAAGIESKGYNWNKLDKTTRKALDSIGDVEKGAVAYEVCRGCHKADATRRHPC